MRTSPPHPTRVLLIASALAILIFLLDVAIPQANLWGLLLLPILFVFLWGRRRDIYVAAVLGGALVIAGYWLGGPPVLAGFLLNHLVPLGILWAAAWLLAQHRKMQEQLQRHEQELDGQVKVRTTALAASEERYRTLFDHAADGIFSVDADGRYVEINDRYCRMLGRTRGEIAGAHLNNMTVGITPEFFATVGAELVDHGSATFERQLRHKDGTFPEVEVTVAPLSGRGRMAIVRDITQRKAAERERLFLSALVASSPEAVVGRKVDGTILSWNRGAEQIFGYTAAEAIGQNLTMLAAPGVLGCMEAGMAEVAQGSAVEGSETTRKAKDGRIFDCRVSSFPVRAAGGEIIGVASFTHDISERRRLEATATRLAAIVESSSDAIASTDLQGRVVSWNRSAEQMYGCSAAQAIGRPISEFLPPPQGTDEAAIIASVLSGSTVPVADRSWTKADGTKVDLAIVLAPVKDKGGAVIGMASVARDITARKAAERERLFLSALVASSPEAVVGRMVDGTILSWNRGAEQLFGYTPADAIGQNLTMLAAPEGRAGIVEIMAEVAQGRAVEGVETQRMTKDGRIFDCRISSFPVREAGGKIIGVASFTHDISERKRAEAALAAGEAQLREALQRLQLATEAANTGVWSWNIAGSRLEWDERMCELYAMTAEERQAGVSMDFWRSRIHPDDLALVEAAHGGPNVFDQASAAYRIVLPSGELRHVQASALMEYGPDEQPRRIIGVNRDVTDQVRYEQLLQDTNAALEQRVAARTADLQSALADLQRANKLKDEFMAMVSHELRTPLTGVLSMSEILEEQVAGPLNARQATYVKAITQSGERLLEVVGGILSYTHLLSGRIEFYPEPVDLPYLLDTCAASQRQKAAAKYQPITVQVDPPDLALTADPFALAEVLKRLLDNAVKFTPAGGRIGIEACPGKASGTVDQPKGVDIVVWDTGAGIPPDQLDHIFHAFVQGDGTLARPHEGLGLGLAYVDQMVRLLGGTIAVKSEMGKGTRFTITLPLAAPNPN